MHATSKCSRRRIFSLGLYWLVGLEKHKTKGKHANCLVEESLANFPSVAFGARKDEDVKKGGKARKIVKS